MITIDGTAGEGGGQILRSVLAGVVVFTTTRPTLHTNTNFETIRTFLEVVVTIDTIAENQVSIIVGERG
jgi:RNA 3'-terminal phosphate cyclase